MENEKRPEIFVYDDCDHVCASPSGQSWWSRDGAVANMVHAIMAAHLITAMILLYHEIPSQLALGRICLLLTVIFVGARSRFTRLFSLAPTSMGIITALGGLIDACSLHQNAVGLGAAASRTGISLLSDLRSRALMHAALLACLGSVQALNLALHLSSLRVQTAETLLADKSDTKA
ncbi:LAFA_0F11100g1_1 [Lachancea sp. 'fantastica']|nr:LAFA_0F11100g1_1 [Lachancea sp. 'fantastica']